MMHNLQTINLLELLYCFQQNYFIFLPKENFQDCKMLLSELLLINNQIMEYQLKSLIIHYQIIIIIIIFIYKDETKVIIIVITYIIVIYFIQVIVCIYFDQKFLVQELNYLLAHLNQVMYLMKNILVIILDMNIHYLIAKTSYFGYFT